MNLIREEKEILIRCERIDSEINTLDGVLHLINDAATRSALVARKLGAQERFNNTKKHLDSFRAENGIRKNGGRF